MDVSEIDTFVNHEMHRKLFIRISYMISYTDCIGMINMSTINEIGTIIESVADERATFDETSVLGLYSGAEMDEYLDSLMGA